MTENEKQMVRTNTPMSAFTFFLDDVTKLETMKKLRSLGIDCKKGAISATIRMLLSQFANDVFDDKVNLKAAIEKEYLFSVAKNKRSSL